MVRRTHFVRKGSAIAYCIDKDGSEHVIQFAIEGWWVSDLHSYISGEAAIFNVQAFEDCELYEFTYENMQQLYLDVPQIQSYFLTITQNGYSAFLQRVLNNISLDAEARYKIFAAKYPGIELRFSQKLIASYLGMSPEFLSKIKKRLR
jgi:CRP-like cAMP-binding protein